MTAKNTSGRSVIFKSSGNIYLEKLSRQAAPAAGTHIYITPNVPFKYTSNTIRSEEKGSYVRVGNVFYFHTYTLL